MDLDTCVICRRETPDPLLWPPDANSRIIACEGCFIELFLLSEEFSSSAPTLLSSEIPLDNGDETSIQEPEPDSPRPPTKNRRFTTRWAYKRSAKMSWLENGSPVSVNVQLRAAALQRQFGSPVSVNVHLDGSEQGLGIRSPKAVDAGRAVRIKLTDATALRGDVQYCSPLRDVFRLGVLLRYVQLLPSS